jgi:hypothetical protein
LDRFFRGHEVDYFVHAWQNDQHHVDLFNPVAVSNSAPADLLQKERRVISTFREYSFIRLVSMYWGIGECIKLVPREQYDVIVRIRPDIVPLSRINFSLTNFHSDAVFFAYHLQQAQHVWKVPIPPRGVDDPSFAGLNDLLFFGSDSAMRPFENSYDLIDDFCSNGEGFHFEAATLLYYFLSLGTKTFARAPISLHLIDPEHAKSPIVLYEGRSRARPRREADTRYVEENHPDLLELFKKDIPPASAKQTWFYNCWAQGPGGTGSPTLSPAAQRFAHRRFRAAQQERSAAEQRRLQAAIV